MGEIKIPLRVNEKPAGREKEELTKKNEGVAMNSQYMQTLYQSDVWTGYQGKLQYDMAKMQMELEKSHITMQQRLDYEKRLNELRVQYTCYLQMMSSTVYKDSSGNIVYAITAPDNKNIISRVLLNVKNFRSCIYICYYPAFQMVLEVRWGDGDDSLRFQYTEEGILPNDFLRRLKARGVLLLVSGRTEKKAACALLAYSLESAEKIEIPFAIGWGKNKVGKWHYATQDELTMKEVMNDAFV